MYDHIRPHFISHSANIILSVYLSSTEVPWQRKSPRIESPHHTFTPSTAARPRPGLKPRTLKLKKKLHRAVIESSRPSRHRIREHLHPRRLGFHPPGRRHPKRRPARRPGAKTYRQHTAASRSKPAPPRNNPAARDGEREREREQRGLPEAGRRRGTARGGPTNPTTTRGRRRGSGGGRWR